MSTTAIFWKADPDYRGTLNILSSCLSTLLICLWSAVHDDVTKGKRWHQRIMRKIYWTVTALLIPELLLFIAYNQYSVARDLMKRANELLPGIPPPPPPSSCWRNIIKFKSLRHVRSQESAEDIVPLRDTYDLGPPVEDGVSVQAGSTLLSGSSSHHGDRRYRWTLTHAFFVVMGGFKLDGHDEEGNRYIPKWQGEAIITPFGLAFLMTDAPHLIPDISADEIRDKSKADGMAKFLVVWQVLWFCINAGTRLAQKLPLTLLEITTIGHGLCTLLIYALWWSKPLGVEEPIVIGSQPKEVETAIFGAWMSIASPAQRYIIQGTTLLQRRAEMHWLGYVSADVLAAEREANPLASDFVLRGGKLIPLSDDWTENNNDTFTSRDGDQLELVPYHIHVEDDHGQTITASVEQTAGRLFSGTHESYAIPNHAELTILPFHCTSDYMPASLSSSLEKRILLFIYDYTLPWYESRDHRPIEADPTCQTRWKLAASKGLAGLNKMRHFEGPLLVPSATLKSWGTANAHENISHSPLTAWSAVTLLPAVHGAPHLLGFWNTKFPTHTEQILWRAATLVVTGSGCLITLLFFLFELLEGLDVFDYLPGYQSGNKIIGFLKNVLTMLMFLPLFTPTSVLPVAYAVASLYLLIESIRQLFALPPGAFQLPSWTESIPHFA